MLSSWLILFSFRNEQCQVTYNLVLEGNQSNKSIFPQINKKCYEMHPSVSSNWNNLSSEGMLIALGGVLTDDFCLQMDQNILKQK